VFPVVSDFSKNGTNSEFIAVHTERKIKSLLDYMQKLTQLFFKMAIYLLHNISIMKLQQKLHYTKCTPDGSGVTWLFKKIKALIVYSFPKGRICV
jgi:hypothetical protein